MYWRGKAENRFAVAIAIGVADIDLLSLGENPTGKGLLYCTNRKLRYAHHEIYSDRRAFRCCARDRLDAAAIREPSDPEEG